MQAVMDDAPDATCWAETADLRYDDGYFSLPGTFMKSNYRDALCCFVSNQSSTRENSSSALFGGEQCEQHQQDMNSGLGIKTIKSFEARLKRLEELNEKLTTLAQNES
jgi:hypothetical protein